MQCQGCKARSQRDRPDAGDSQRGKRNAGDHGELEQCDSNLVMSVAIAVVGRQLSRGSEKLDNNSGTESQISARSPGTGNSKSVARRTSNSA